jgi:nucleotide-binding universal stress UspA family protein
MIPKIILVPFGGYDTELSALEAAADLARKYNAHIAVWHVMPDPKEEMRNFAASLEMGAGYLPVNFLKDAIQRNRNSLSMARKKYSRFLRVMQIADADRKTRKPGPTASFHSTLGFATDVLRVQARLADIVVLSHAYRQGVMESRAIVSSIVFDSGRPVLLVPAGRHGKIVGEDALIAWNASTQAARAVSAALPLMCGGKATVVSAVEAVDSKFPLTPQELCTYLDAHGVKAKALLIRKKSANPAADLLKAAYKTGAGFIVMGAYTHSRAREWLLGGVTDHMLDRTPIPVLFAH